ncbi:MAG: helix-turn-helix domain-containing protein [Deltaproteobacteria bacterium]|nr:helix-turn-helix domain-containing protein [Deltaproteobacteria bacterium]
MTRGIEEAPSKMVEEYVDTDALADILKIHPQTARNLARRGRIPCLKVGKTYRFSLARVEAALGRP